MQLVQTSDFVINQHFWRRGGRKERYTTQGEMEGGGLSLQICLIQFYILWWQPRDKFAQHFIHHTIVYPLFCLKQEKFKHNWMRGRGWVGSSLASTLGRVKLYISIYIFCTDLWVDKKTLNLCLIQNKFIIPSSVIKQEINNTVHLYSSIFFWRY